ncbi:MAG: hypothetical protein IJQ65_06630 [Kiritimatiellae bacterium]|nr:hypothetical protein [Kiritimatiellia bacterium]
MNIRHVVKSIAAFALLACPSQAAERLCVYCSPEGDDADPGTFVRPLRTLTAARDRIRAAKRG